MAKAPKYMAVQAAALFVGPVLIVLGVLGFLPGITHDFDRLAWFGHESGARLVGAFAVSGLQNTVNVVIGALGLVLARSYAAARAYFLGGGLVYAALWTHALIAAHDFAPMPFAFAVIMIILGLTLAGQRDPTRRRRRIRA
ncbi:DUF4383 domain-containing protein [Mycolicibacterium sp. GF69]|uniref:DUF4383 domain-containing protein n=1 Tax=Mycolicibacterium sp. GF69 TaxID=2267251 RepID=UPI000DCBABEE|nr:DUF4383 domain-containing protein [Mycolicibacterium sp. GF69]RAV13960.1 DUF4383 domain-containing protein [Mycolicibacterium sp. GF69]